MHRYFINEFDGTNFYLRDENFHHAKNVVRLKVDQEVVCIFNEEEFLSKIEQVNDDVVIAMMVKKILTVEKKYRVTLIVGIIREQKWDFVLQKATELGVDIIVPVIFKRNVVKIENKKMESKIARWRKICEDASEQSYKNAIPTIEPIVTNILDLEKYKSDVNICCYELGSETGLAKLYQNKNSFTFVVGPEGGFDESEIEKFKNMKYEIVKFSKNILRAETVPLYLLSTLMFNFE
jgi:16S rRNA (uracil1498-N3)-methyltransferase